MFCFWFFILCGHVYISFFFTSFPREAAFWGEPSQCWCTGAVKKEGKRCVKTGWKWLQDVAPVFTSFCPIVVLCCFGIVVLWFPWLDVGSPRCLPRSPWCLSRCLPRRALPQPILALARQNPDPGESRRTLDEPYTKRTTRLHPSAWQLIVSAGPDLKSDVLQIPSASTFGLASSRWSCAMWSLSSWSSWSWDRKLIEFRYFTAWTNMVHW